MTLDRGALARIDRAILAALDHERTTQLVKVPLSEATWSTWRRYCDVIGIPMGHAIATLVEHELSSVVEDVVDRPTFLANLERVTEERRHELDTRERGLDTRERSVDILEQWLSARTGVARGDPGPTPASARPTKVGRNEPCPCGSGVKYKRCHGR
jgi:uncharacterized protein YecA (UPF0149 family)